MGARRLGKSLARPRSTAHLSASGYCFPPFGFILLNGFSAIGYTIRVYIVQLGGLEAMQNPCKKGRIGTGLGMLFVLSILSPNAGVYASSENDSMDRVDILIAVDESASLTSASVRAMKDALRTIIQAPEVRQGGVRIGVLPFSSGNNLPRRVSSCELTEINGESKQRLLNCVDQIVRQRKKGQSDTDFSGIIDSAITDFAKTDATKVILLLTDGKYDPDGDEIISPLEKSDLDKSLKNAKNNKVSLWALGFGKADKIALDSYVRAGDGGDKNCASRPEAVIADVTDLSAEMQRILDFATCTGGTLGAAYPKFEFVVNPLLSKVNIEVTAGVSLKQSAVSVTGPDGSLLCADAEIEGGRWVCTESVGGGDGGVWTVATSVKGALARATWNGSINVQVIKCLVEKESVPVAAVKVSRADGQSVNYDFDSDAQWPQVIVTLSDGKDQIYRTNEIELKKETTEILGIDEVPIGTHIDVDFNRDVSEEERLLIRADQISNCVLGPATVATTTSSSIMSTTTVASVPTTVASIPTTVAPIGEEEQPASPWLLYLVGLFVLLAAGAFAYTKLGGKKFPDEAELFVRNPVNPAVFNSVEIIAGLRKVYFDLESGRNGASVVITTKQDARYKLTLVDEESLLVKSLWKPENVDDEGDDETDQTSILDIKAVVLPGEPITPLVGESFNVRDCDSESAPNKSDAVYLKVDWPEIS